MKKLLLIGLVFALAIAFAPSALAVKGGQHGFPQYECAPTGFEAEVFDAPGDVAPDTIVRAEVCFDWTPPACGTTPTKYSIDVELLVDGDDWGDPDANIQKLSFSTGDRTDGEDMNAPFLCVPISAFVYYDTVFKDYLPFTGEARAKVKALGKGKSQNNPFSDWDYFLIEGEVDGVADDLTSAP